MSNDPSLELQKAFKTILEADSELASLMGGAVLFYDYTPEREHRPYIEYRQGQVQEWDTSIADNGDVSGNGKQHTVSFNVWSDYEGVKQLRYILRRIYDIVQDNTSLILNGHALVNLRFMFEDVVRESDGQVFHGIAQYRAITEEI